VRVSEGNRGDRGVEQNYDLLEERLRRAGQTRREHTESERALVELELSRSTLPTSFNHYMLTRYIAGGATGRVYEAVDARSDHRVALKIFRDGGPHTMDLLKREARALSRISHPNLVTFLEAGVDRGLCYLVMELIRGKSIAQHLPRGARVGSLASARADFGRLRSALRQLASALAALHGAGMVHRDVKPSNVLVTDEGRLVVVDFGLCHNPDGLGSTFAGRPVGTPAYMSPEQLERGSGSAASDCYAIGVILFEALVGHLPHHADTVEDVSRLRSDGRAPWPSQFARDVPPNLDMLCHDLLAVAPDDRPTCEEILERLGTEPSARRAGSLGHGEQEEQETLFVGRQAELSALQAAVAACVNHGAVLALGGPAGVGKSMLVRHFLRSLSPERHVVLVAKCHERETLPNKALDALMDALVPYLRTLSPEELEGLLPRHMHELVRMFPSLSRIGPFARALYHSTKADEQEQKQRAISALAELAGRLADRFVLVVWIDDLQWGDRDSMEFFRQLLSTERLSNCLFLGSLRTDVRRPERLIRRFLGTAFGSPAARSAPTRTAAGSIAIQALRLNPLGASEARTLAADLLAGFPDRVADELIEEAQGSPFLISLLAGHARELTVTASSCSRSSTREGAEPTRITLSSVVRARLERLSTAAIDVVQLVALAAGPIDQRVILTAAGLDHESAFHELRTAQLVRTQGRHRRVELYHEALAAAVLVQLDEVHLRGLHGRLAKALIEREVPQYERIAFHLRAAGCGGEAKKYLLLDAARSHSALAHGRAARLYRLALESGLDEPEAQTTRIAYAHAMRGSGRGQQAAEAYLAAAVSEADSWRRFELQRRAAQEFLLTGLFDRGIALLKELVPIVRVSLPRSRVATVIGLLWRRALLRLRGIRFRLRPEREVSKFHLARLDTMWMLGQGLVIFDAVLGINLQSRYVLLALCSGEPTRIARALALEAVRASYSGQGSRPRVDRLLDRAHQLGADLPDALASATTTLWSSAAAYFMGEPRRALQEVELAERALREECAGTAWELATAHLVVLGSLYMLGDWPKFEERCRRAVREAESRGNRFQSVGLRAHTHLARLIADDVEGARGELQYVRDEWPQKDFHMQHLALFFGEARIRLYLGDGVGACEHLAAMWPDARRSFLLRARLLRVEALAWRARAHALAYGQTGHTPHRSEALHCAGALAREGFLGSQGHALCTRAAVAASERGASSLELWHAAARAYERDHLSFFAAVATYQASRLQAQVSDKGRPLQNEIAFPGVANVPAAMRMFTGWL